MRSISLEKQIAGIINNGKVISKEDFGKDSEIRTIESGNFKCSAPMDYVADLLANARRMSRKKPERYPVPKTQNILAFLSNNRDVIPYFVKIVEGKSENWFKRQIYLNFPETAKQILKDAVYGNKADMQYAFETMPPAWRVYAERDVCQETKVVFRTMKTTGDVIALLPEKTCNDGSMVTSYTWFGGLSKADYNNIIEQSEPAKRVDYSRLMCQLESLYFEQIKVVSRAEHKMYLH